MTRQEFDAALTSAQREAKASFGDDRVLVEKFIESPRHIEVQVFGDSHGNYIHLFERDCSLQRRRQKVIEEAPAPGMTDAVRKAMTDAALMAAKAVGYRNAGTIEFIVDGSGALRPDGFWFMEMNTRLQVEHPVTEMITGLDLVELQLHVASGGKLPAQSEIRLNGHAVEARLCAEDPARGFLPSSGLLEAFDLSAFSDDPGGGVTLRLDSAVEEGDVVPAAYDSMIAKAIAHAPTRDGAMDALGRRRCATAEIWPVTTNAAMLANLLDQPEVREGVATTNLVEANINELASARRRRTRRRADPRRHRPRRRLQRRRRRSVGAWPTASASTRAPRSTFVFEIGGESAGTSSSTRDDDGVERAHVGAGDFRGRSRGTPTIDPGVIVAGAIDGADVMGVVRKLADGPVLFMKRPRRSPCAARNTATRWKAWRRATTSARRCRARFSR